MWTLFMSGEAAGNAVVRVGSSVVFTIDTGNFPNIGTPGAGSGERDVAISPPIGVVPGTTVSLDLGGCSGCSTLTVTYAAAGR
jgi:hypothetical protein